MSQPDIVQAVRAFDASLTEPELRRQFPLEQYAFPDFFVAFSKFLLFMSKRSLLRVPTGINAEAAAAAASAAGDGKESASATPRVDGEVGCGAVARSLALSRSREHTHARRRTRPSAAAPRAARWPR